MGHTVHIVYAHLVEDDKGDQAMLTEALPRQYDNHTQAELAGAKAVERLRAEGKAVSHYLVFDGEGRPVDHIGAPID